MSLIVSRDAFQKRVRTLSEIPVPDFAVLWLSTQQEVLAEAGDIAGHPAERAVGALAG